MNRKQKAIVWIGMVLIVAMGIYPPVQMAFAYRGPWQVGGVVYGESFYGYRWLFLQVEPHVEQPLTTYQHIEIERLLVQWAMVCIVVGGLVWTLGSAKPSGVPAPDSSDVKGD